MPKTTVVFYQDDSDTVPVLDWLDSLKHSTNVGFGSNGCVIWDMNFGAPSPIFCETAFTNYGLDSAQ